MKAYKVGLYSSDEAGNEIIFANNSKEAIVKAHRSYVAEGQESYIDVYAKRDEVFDGMENATDAEMMYKMFQMDWQFEDFEPDLNDDCTFEEFKDEYEKFYE